MEGWIKLHRKIIDHWIYKDSLKFHWWIDILLMVNHEDNKVNIGFELFECKRGQSIMSLKNWADRWNVNKDTARNFLKLLEKDGMIIHENLSKTTRLTVCNYEDYQISLHNRQTMGKRKTNDGQTQSDPNKNDKNDKEYIYDYFYDEQIELSNGDQNYIQFVKILFGENNLKIPLKGVLKIKNQLTYSQFQLVYTNKVKNNVSLTTILENIENRPDLLKKYSLLQRVLLNWMKPKENKK